MTIYEDIGAIAASIGVNYEFGSWKSLQKYLIDSVKNKKAISTRYPAMFLITPDQSEDEDINNTYDTEYDIHIVIVSLTKPNYSNQQRLDNNFKPILYPIYNDLIDELRAKSKDDYKKLPRTKKDIFYFSSSDAKEANVLAEHLDAIEITGLKVVRNYRETECNN